ncbi:MAG TPA: hypothetical protein DDZ80_04015 [Cyanobacteria bacterium UBA8803]|nr:hypothetical protein [Cyanobacteria bacterium UBA9273]HBL57728.1 hypothetical protein [Cyanobacteria bacterium UBA8803]
MAAGASTRLGQPKQLLNLRGKRLVHQMAEIAITSSGNPIGIVLGAHIERIQPLISDLPIHRIDNYNWATGIVWLSSEQSSYIVG